MITKTYTITNPRDEAYRTADEPIKSGKEKRREKRKQLRKKVKKN